MTGLDRPLTLSRSGNGPLFFLSLPVIAFVESDQEIPGLPNSVSISSSLEGVRTFVMTQLGLIDPTGSEDLVNW